MKQKYITPSIRIVYPKMRICNMQTGSVQLQKLKRDDNNIQNVGDFVEI